MVQLWYLYYYSWIVTQLHSTQYIVTQFTQLHIVTQLGLETGNLTQRHWGPNLRFPVQLSLPGKTQIWTRKCLWSPEKSWVQYIVWLLILLCSDVDCGLWKFFGKTNFCSFILMCIQCIISVLLIYCILCTVVYGICKYVKQQLFFFFSTQY